MFVIKILYGLVFARLILLGSAAPSCDSSIYCDGLVLKTVQLAKIFSDSKTFVDMVSKQFANIIPLFLMHRLWKANIETRRLCDQSILCYGGHQCHCRSNQTICKGKLFGDRYRGQDAERCNGSKGGMDEWHSRSSLSRMDWSFE